VSTESPVRNVIDLALGDDVADARGEVGIQQAWTAQKKPRTAEESLPPSVAASEELPRARRIVREASQIIYGVMHDVRQGNEPSFDQVGPVVERITESVLRNNGALLSLARAKNKDNYTYMHSVSVCALLVCFGRALGMGRNDLHQLGIGGMLHDVGKFTIPDRILNKPGPLTDEEFAEMKTHAGQSRHMLSATPGMSQRVIEIAAEHHERHDGSGYPEGLKGEAISLMGQMAAICDVYDAITSDRVYRKAIPPTEALSKIYRWSEIHFSPNLVQTFLRTIGIYPVGSLVMLESGRLAVVLEQHAASLLTPCVRIIFHARGNYYVPPEDLDLSRTFGRRGGDRIVGHEAPEKWVIDPIRFL
jgi:HD-GYP domain-containing protein (c-di-GMP phosphodiesterase class II)